MMKWLRQVWCNLFTRHNDASKYFGNPGWLHVRCKRCGYESVGIQIQLRDTQA